MEKNSYKIKINNSKQLFIDVQRKAFELGYTWSGDSVSFLTNNVDHIIVQDSMSYSIHPHDFELSHCPHIKEISVDDFMAIKSTDKYQWFYNSFDDISKLATFLDKLTNKGIKNENIKVSNNTVFFFNSKYISK